MALETGTRDGQPEVRQARPDTIMELQISRRRLLAGGLSAGAAAFLAACSGSGPASTPAPTAPPSTAQPSAAQPSAAQPSATQASVAPTTAPVVSATPASFKGTTINIFSGTGIQPPVQFAATRWEAATGGKAIVTGIPYKDRRIKMAGLIATQDPTYDLAYAYEDWLPGFDERLYIPLDGKVGDTSDFLPSVIKSLTSLNSGHLLALPIHSDQMIWLYNREYFQKAGLDPDKPPTTWDEYWAATPKFKAAGILGGAAAWLTAFYGYFYWTIIWNSLGKPALSNDRTSVLINNDDGLLAFKTINDGFKAGFFDPDAVTLSDEGETQKLFNSGKVATHMGWGVYWKQARSGNVKDFNATISKDAVGASIIPGIKSGTSGTIQGSEGLGVLKFSKNQEAAIDFLRFATSAESEKAIWLDPTASQGNSVPARASVLKDPDVIADFPIAATWAEEGNWPHDMSAAPFDHTSPFDASIQKMYKGEFTPEQALEATVAGLNDKITKYLSQ